MSQKIRIGIIGCGQIAQHHLRTYQDIPEAEVVACADIKPEAADKSAQTFGIPNVYYNAHEMLKRDDLDAIDVCLHNNFHLPATKLVLESGRHCYCEKPMAGAYADAITMLETAKSTGKMLHIQLAGLYSTEVMATKELIENGVLGDVYFARVTGHRRRGRPYVDGYGTPTFVQKPNSGGGALYDMGVYHISEMLHLLGNPTPRRISGKTWAKMPMDKKRGVEFSVEELAAGFIRFDNDLAMDITEAWAMHLDTLESSFVLGSNAGVKLHPFGLFQSHGDLDLNSTADMGAARYRWRKLNSEDGDTDLMTNSQVHWIAALQGRTPLLPTAEIALNTMLISEGIYLSEQLGREVTADEVRDMSKSKAGVV
jgi:predicted dehydrogenase